MTLIRLCRWGMHVPGATKVFHRGALFTRCSECGETLLAGQRGWFQVPRGKRVVWRDRTPEERMFAISPNTDRARLKPRLSMILRRVGHVREAVGRSGA